MASWDQVIAEYDRKATATLAGKCRTIVDAPNHVAVLAQDLQYMCAELRELALLRAKLERPGIP